MASSDIAEACYAVQHEAAKRFGVSVTDIKSERQTGSAAVARKVAIYVMHEVFGFPPSGIADHALRDPSTVKKAIADVRGNEDLLAAAFDVAKEIVGEDNHYLGPTEFDEVPPLDDEAAA